MSGRQSQVAALSAPVVTAKAVLSRLTLIAAFGHLRFGPKTDTARLGVLR